MPTTRSGPSTSPTAVVVSSWFPFKRVQNRGTALFATYRPDEDRRVDDDLVEPGHADTGSEILTRQAHADRLQQLDCLKGNDDSERAARQCKRDTLRERLSKQPAGARRRP
jgi:hypothetical protein